MAINVADNFSYKGAKPLDARVKYDTIAAMVAVPAADLYDGCMAYVTANKLNYQYDSSNDTDPTLGKWREFSSGGGTDYTAGDGIVIENDEISIDPMPAEDMDEIVSPKPVTAKGGHRYSTEEQIVGTWIDGKTLYEKTVVGDIPITQTEETDATTVITVSQNVDTFCHHDALIAVERTQNDVIYFGEYGNMGSDKYRSVTYYKDSSNVLQVTLHNKYRAWSGKMIVTLQYTKTTD